MRCLWILCLIAVAACRSDGKEHPSRAADSAAKSAAIPTPTSSDPASDREPPLPLGKDDGSTPEFSTVLARLPASFDGDPLIASVIEDGTLAALYQGTAT